MTIRHHLDDATLIAFAAGTLPPPLALVAAAHLELCARCRREMSLLDALGASFLDGLPESALSRPAPVVAARSAAVEPVEADVVLAQHRTASPAKTKDGVPATIAALLGSPYEALPWKRLSLGLWRHDLDMTRLGYGKPSGRVYLLKGSPGVAIPEHMHEGGELTLVLRGAYADATGRFATGDVADLDTETEHTPIADSREGCICVVGEEGPPRFRGLAARVVNRLR